MMEDLRDERESLSSLPYSIEEIYGIRTSGKYGTLKQSYHEFYQLYGVDTYEKSVKPDIIITEDRLENPSKYIESKEYFSWERFFMAVLIEETKGTYLAYAKKKLNAAYLSDTIKKSILEQMKKIEL